MNFKRIDAAAAAYEGKLDERDRARLAFFRSLWEAASSCAPENAPEAKLPSAGRLRALRAEGLPVFSEAPARLDAEAFARGIEAVCACAMDQEDFSQEVRDALARTKWERIVAASPLPLAGADPTAYFDELAGILMDDGMGEGEARIACLLASLALRVQLEEPAAAAAKAMEKAGIGEPHPLVCPVCGCAPAAARVGGDTSSSGRGRVLWCPQCGTEWEFERVRCARCGTRNQAHLHFHNIEGDDAHRIASCEECGGYIRTVYLDDALAPFSFEVEDVAMARLDAIALDPSFAGGKEARA